MPPSSTHLHAAGELGACLLARGLQHCIQLLNQQHVLVEGWHEGGDVPQDAICLRMLGGGGRGGGGGDGCRSTLCCQPVVHAAGVVGLCNKQTPLCTCCPRVALLSSGAYRHTGEAQAWWCEVLRQRELRTRPLQPLTPTYRHAGACAAALCVPTCRHAGTAVLTACASSAHAPCSLCHQHSAMQAWPCSPPVRALCTSPAASRPAPPPRRACAR